MTGKTLSMTTRLGCLPLIVLALGSISLRAQNFTAAVDTTSAPQIIGESAPQCGTAMYDCVEKVASAYFTGPGASYFNVVGVSGWSQGGYSLSLTFSPTVVPPAGQTLNATLNYTYSQCPANGTGPGSPCTTYGPISVNVAGTVTGSLPVGPAQIQITPTQPVAIVAAPGATAVGLSGNDIFVGFPGSFQLYSAGVWTTLVGTGTPGFDGVYGIPTTPGGPTNTPGDLVNGIYGIYGVYFSDSGNSEVQYPQYFPPANGLPAYYKIKDFIGLAYPASQCNELNLGQAGDLNLEFPGCTTVPSLPAAELATNAGVVSLPTTFYLAYPTAIAFDGANYYIADTGSGTVDKLSGVTLSTLAGGANQNSCGGYEIGRYGTTQCVIYVGDTGDGGLAFNAQINPPTSLAYSNGYLFIASDEANLPYTPPAPSSDNNIRMVAGSNIITTPLYNGQPLTGGGLVFDSLGNLYITSKNPIQKVTFDANENPISVTDWAPNPGGYSPAMSDTGAIVVADGTNINQIGNTGFVTLTSPGLGVATTAAATITNSGGSGLVLGAVSSITGANAADFSLDSDGCSSNTIVSGGTCAYTFKYTPSTLSTETAQVTVTSNVGTGSQIINLTGTVSALSLSTPVVPSGQDGTALSSPITATATGGVPPYTFTTSLDIHSGNWSLTSNGGNVSISGTPTVSGPIPFSLTVTDNAGTQATVNAVLHAGSITLSQPALAPSYYIVFGENVPMAASTMASGGTAPYQFSVTYPANTGTWTMSTPDGVNGYLSLLPLAVGALPFTINVMDATGATGSVTGIMGVQQMGTVVQVVDQPKYFPNETLLVLTGNISTAPFGTVDPSAAKPTGTVDFLIDGVDQHQPQVVTGGTTQAAFFNVDVLFHTIDATYSGDANYTNSAWDIPVTVNGNRPQTITFPGNGLTIPENVPVALTAYASSGLPVTYAVFSGPGMLDPTGMNLIATGPGQIVVSAYQAGDQSFAPSNYVYANFIAQ